MKRLIFCPGIGQIMNAAAALDQDHGEERARDEDTLILFGKNPRSQYGETMSRIAGAVWPWHAVYWARDLLLWYFPTRRFAPIARDIMHQRYGAEADEIWVSKLYMDPVNVILYAYPDARVMMYEDGVEEYIPQEITCGPTRWKSVGVSGWPGALWREISHWNRRPECMEADGVCARNIRRIDRMYSYLGRYLGMPPHLADVRMESVDADGLKRRYRALSVLAGDDHCAPPHIPDLRPKVLYLSQPLATYSMSEEDEYSLYRYAIPLLNEKGYAVLWKEHPDEATSLAPRLKEEFGNDCLYPLHAERRLPVECLVAGWDLAAVVSATTTSLFILHGLYGLPIYTVADYLPLASWRQKPEREVARLYSEKIPGLDQLPVAGSGIPGEDRRM